MTRRLLTLCVTILAFCSTVTSKAENPKPFVIPELRSWNGGEGALSIGNVTKVFYTDASLSIAAEEFADDYGLLFGKGLKAKAIKANGKTPDGSIVLNLYSVFLKLSSFLIFNTITHNKQRITKINNFFHKTNSFLYSI